MNSCEVGTGAISFQVVFIVPVDLCTMLGKGKKWQCQDWNCTATKKVKISGVEEFLIGVKEGLPISSPTIELIYF